MSSRAIRRLVIFLALVGLAGLVVLAFARAGEWLDVSQVPVAADFAFVVPGEENTRPFVAGILYRRGLVRKILVPENESGSAQLAEILPTTGRVIVEVLRRRGVSPDDIIPVGGATTNSWDDLATLSKFLQSHPEATVLVITSSFHTRRCRWILRQQLGHLSARTIFVAAPVEWYDGFPWWSRREVAATVIGEYLKLGYYWIRYGHGGLWITGAAAGLLMIWVLLKFRKSKTLTEAGGKDVSE